MAKKKKQPYNPNPPETFTQYGKSFRAIGRGNYPYECQMKDEYPDAMIYRSEPAGSWCTEFDIPEDQK